MFGLRLRGVSTFGELFCRYERKICDIVALVNIVKYWMI